MKKIKERLIIEINSISIATIIDQYDMYFVEFSINDVPQAYRTLKEPELLEYIENVNPNNYKEVEENPELYPHFLIDNCLEMVVENYLNDFPFVESDKN